MRSITNNFCLGENAKDSILVPEAKSMSNKNSPLGRDGEWIVSDHHAFHGLTYGASFSSGLSELTESKGMLKSRTFFSNPYSAA